jgi:hypothetical protein
MRAVGAMLGLLSAVLVLGGPVEAQELNLLERVLTDRRLWGEDAFAVFGTLVRWRAAGETHILLYPDRVVSGSKSDTPDPARQRLAQIGPAMQRPLAAVRSPFAATYAAAVTARAPGFRAEVQHLPEDESFRVVWSRPDGEFLRRGVTTRSVIETYGRPERTTTEVVHGRGERRPAVLTLHHYANGAVVFVESDLAPTPGVVDRVVLEVSAATALIFATTP